MKHSSFPLILLLSFLVSPNLSAQSIPLPGFEVDSINGALDGGVAFLEEEGWSAEGRLYLRRIDFDHRGRPLVERFTNGNNTPGSWIEYRYGEDGRLATKLFHHPDAPIPDTEEYVWEGERLFSVARIFTSGKYGWRYEYHYDGEGRLFRAVKIDRYWKDVVVWTKDYSFDKAGRLKEVSGGGLDENIQWREVFYYAPGKMVPSEKTRLDYRGEVNSRILYSYDGRGSLLSERDLSPDGSSWGEVVFHYRYDDRGNWTEKLVGTPVLTEGRGFFDPASWYIRRYTYREEN